MAPRLGLGGGVTADPNNNLFDLLLDEYGDDCYGAYSLRKLKRTTTNVCQCIRDSDSATQDFTSAELTDGALITTFGASTTARVKTLYDQSGNGNHATQSTLLECPELATALSGLLRDSNGLPWMNFHGVEHFIPLSTALPNIDIGSCSSLVVGKFDSMAGSQQVMFSLGVASGNKRWYAPTAYSSEFNWGYGDDWDHHQETQDTDVHLFTTIAGSTQGNWQPFIDGTSQTSKTLQTGASSGTYGIGGVVDSNDFPLNGKIQEVLVFDADKSVERTSIEADILSYYSLD
tara:strand:- start:289 stop:1155 length:867 start_codon:yes stop_codon:yes gene_type:complete